MPQNDSLANDDLAAAVGAAVIVRRPVMSPADFDWAVENLNERSPESDHE
jgi:hypothetical protein